MSDRTQTTSIDSYISAKLTCTCGVPQVNSKQAPPNILDLFCRTSSIRRYSTRSSRSQNFYTQHSRGAFLWDDPDLDQWSDIIRIMVDQMNRWIHSGQGFIDSFDLPCSKLSRITDSDPDHPKGTYPRTDLQKYDLSRVGARVWNEIPERIKKLNM